MLTNIHIRKLFHFFDYEIPINKEGITILTGPNGYGKTTILRMLHALANKDVFYFSNLVFDEFAVFFDDEKNIKITNHTDEILFYRNNEKPLNIQKDSLIKKLRKGLRNTPFRQVDEDEWLDRRNGEILTTYEIFRKMPNILLEELKNALGFHLTNSLDSYFIREQRLIKTGISRKPSRERYFNEDEIANPFEETIEGFAKQLKKLITNKLAESTNIAQELDSSFPSRLFEEDNEISEDEFFRRFEKIKTTQKALEKYGLSVMREDSHPKAFKSENAKALYVYLNDTEKKLAVFSDLLRKLELFAGIINERRFVNKKIVIERETGFKFVSHDGNPLPLADLSSGEKQEVVLLFELLFKIKPGTLVLIDEPEISLHVAWQKQFLNDLKQMVELQKINVVIATHSPQIINDRWDLTVDLEECGKCENTLITKIS